MYIGLMPETPIAPTKERPPAAALVASELGPAVTLELAARRGDLNRALQDKPLLASLVQLLG